ncbi:hypothetical protein [Actinoplanes sp. NPDC051851]|uniref:hypothetical protein n=1 Tax=Actinoplanes sp. NPDC051851 TaxID=3154753 RepID=UPI0034127F04
MPGIVVPAGEDTGTVAVRRAGTTVPTAVGTGAVVAPEKGQPDRLDSAARAGSGAGPAAGGRPGIGGGPDSGGRPGSGAGPDQAARSDKGGRADADDAGDEAEGGLSELRRKLRTQRRLRLGTLSTLAIVVLLVLPAFFGLRAMSSDPVFASLDALSVPSWADKNVDDQGSGNRWCFMDCRFRERVADSERPFKETSEAYTTALKKAGWTSWKVADCPETAVNADEGLYSCWKRDEFTLDLYVSLPGCAVDQVAAEAVPEAGSEEAEAGETSVEECDGSSVSIKVRNAIADERGKTDTNPGPVGETPDPILGTDDPLLAPTPEAS